MEYVTEEHFNFVFENFKAQIVGIGEAATSLNEIVIKQNNASHALAVKSEENEKALTELISMTTRLSGIVENHENAIAELLQMMGELLNQLSGGADE